MIKRAIVTTLCWLCGVLDAIPAAYRHDGRWHVGTGCWGCYVFKLAERSDDLDQRWNTGVWK